MTQKQQKMILNVIWLGTILAALKIIFFDYTLDEEYQILMSYRNLRGDHLFREMWEPHQTSAFLCTGLMWIYKTIVGTYTGVLVYLRVCTTIIQVLISFYLYKVLGRLIEKEYALLCSLIYFNIVPKLIQIPEFSNMQLWFFTLMILPLMQYYMEDEEKRSGKKYLIIIAGISMALEVLSYPSCLVLFPFVCGYIFVKSKKTKWCDFMLFAGTCVACAVVWLTIILQNVGLLEFLQNFRNMLTFDLTHEISGATQGKGEGILQNIIGGAGLFFLIGVISIPPFVLIKKKSSEWNKNKALLIFLLINIIVAECVQIYCWVFAKSGYEVYQLHLLVILLVAVGVGNKVKKEIKDLTLGIIGTWLSLAAVVYISDLGIFYSFPHGVLGVVFSAIVFVLALKCEMGNSADKWIRIFLISLCFISILGKGYTLKNGRDYNVVLDTRGIMKYGPAVGIMSDYTNAYLYNCNYEDFLMNVSEEDNVLIVANMQTSQTTTSYIMSGAEVAHYSIVDPTAYDERLRAYWELYPEKVPNVIVVDCWYGNLLADSDSWIMEYIENDFGYTQVSEGRYVRFYRK